MTLHIETISDTRFPFTFQIVDVGFFGKEVA